MEGDVSVHSRAGAATLGSYDVKVILRFRGETKIDGDRIRRGDRFILLCQCLVVIKATDEFLHPRSASRLTELPVNPSRTSSERCPPPERFNLVGVAGSIRQSAMRTSVHKDSQSKTLHEPL